MVFPLFAFALGLALLCYLFVVGWFRGSLMEDELAMLRYMLAGQAICVLSLIVWGVLSESPRHRKRWVALILAAVLLIALGAWWIISIGLFIVVIGLALLIYSSARLTATFR